MAVAMVRVSKMSAGPSRPQQQMSSSMNRPQTTSQDKVSSSYTQDRMTSSSSAQPQSQTRRVEQTQKKQQQQQPARKSVDELLTCKICLVRYTTDADGRRMPRELDCRHVFCHSCLVDCDSAERVKYVIPCPLCKKRTILSNDKVLGLPINKQLVSLLKKNEKDDVRNISVSDQIANKRPSALKGSSDIGLQQAGGKHANGGRSKSVLFNPDVDEAIVDEMSVVSLPSETNSPTVSKKVTSTKSKSSSLSVTVQNIPTAIVKHHWRLHPPPNRSAALGEAVENDELATDGEISRDTENSATDSVLSNDGSEAAVVGDTDDVTETVHEQMYPLNDLHELAPKHLLDDLNLLQDAHQVKAAGQIQLYGEGVTQTAVVDNPHVSYSSLLSDLHLMQPTTASYVSSFGKYSQVRTQPGAFSAPTKIGCSAEHRLVIVDVANDTVQAFSTNGECLAIFAVRDVTGACFLNEALLAVASNRGIELYGINGRLTKSIPISPAVAVARYKDGGFVVAHKRSLSVGKTPTTGVRLHTINGARKVGAMSRAAVFDNISDVAVSPRDQICVLDGSSIFVLDEHGIMISSINYGVPLGSPAADDHSLTAKCQPFALAVDPKANQLIVSANRYVSRFSLEDGSFQRCLINLDDQVANDKIRAFGVAANGVGQLFIILRADGLAETAIFSM